MHYFMYRVSQKCVKTLQIQKREKIMIKKCRFHETAQKIDGCFSLKCHL